MLRVLWLLLFALVITVSGAETPLLTAARCPAAPSIDGLLTESVWKNAPGSILYSNENSGKETERTYFSALFDKDYLYLGMTLSQPFFDPILNRLDLVKNQAVKNGDRKIFADDCAEFFFAQDQEKYLHFTVNSDGVWYCESGSGFGLCSPVLNPGIRVKTHRGDREWTLEAAIPRRILKSSGKIRLNVCRSNSPAKQTMAWSPTRSNFHNTARFGELLFSDRAPSIQLLECSNDDVAQGVFRFGQGEYRFSGMVNAENLQVKRGFRRTSLQAALNPENGFSQFIIRAADNTELWRSPVMTGTASHDSAELTFNFPGAYRLFVNGKEIASGSGALQKKIVLPGKINVIGMEASGGNAPLSGLMRLGSRVVTVEDFVTSERVNSFWLKDEYDYTAWPLYQNESIGQKRYFRFVVIRKHALFAPQNPDGTIYLANHVFSSLTLRIGSPLAFAVPDYALELTFPSGITIPRYDFEKRGYKRYKHDLKISSAEGKRFLKFQFHNPMKPLPYNWGYHVVNFILRADFPSGCENGDLPLSLGQRARGMAEYPQDLKIRLLPPYQGVQPRRIVIKMCDPERDNCFCPAEVALMYETFRQVGVNMLALHTSSSGLERIHQMVPVARSQKMHTQLNNFGNVDTWMNTIISKRPGLARVNPIYKAPAWQPGVCPEQYLTDSEIREALQRIFREVDSFCDDAERGIRSVCLCDVCRAKFAKANNLSSVPDAATIYRDHRKELIAWQIDVNRRIIEYQIKLAREVNPRIRSSVYSGYDTSDAPAAYGIDWKVHRGKLDLPEVGYDLAPQIIARTRAALGGQAIIAACIVESGQYERPFGDQRIKARLFHLLRAGGFLGSQIWMWRDLDGRGYTALADFTRGVAEFEDFLDEKKEIPADGLCSGLAGGNVTAYRHNGKILILAVNMSGKNTTIHLRSPEKGKATRFRDFYTGKSSDGLSFQTDVASGDASLITIESIPTKR